MTRRRKALIWGTVALATVLGVTALYNRGTCAYYGWMTDRQVKYRVLLGCMVQVNDVWVPRNELRVVQ